MKWFPILLLMVVHLSTFSQKAEKYYTKEYRYTFSGMKSQDETDKIVEKIQLLKNVEKCSVTFKSPQHKYAQLKVTIRAPKQNNEHSEIVPAGPNDLKKSLISLGYEPHELKETLIEE